MADLTTPPIKDLSIMSVIVANPLGVAIKHNRSRRHMSLQDVADEAGLTKAHVWELESGRCFNPTVATILGLSVALNCSAQELAATAMSDPRVNAITK